MSAEQFQQRLSDLIFSAKEHIKELQTQQDNSEREYADWKSEGEGLEGDELDDHNNEPPDVIDNSSKIAAIEAAIDHVEAAVEELDKALDND